MLSTKILMISFIFALVLFNLNTASHVKKSYAIVSNLINMFVMKMILKIK